MLDLNDAAPQRENGLIPPCITKLHATLRPGDANGPGPDDINVLTSSKSSDTKILNFEFTVMTGPHAKRKFFQTMTVEGGKVDASGVSVAWNITKSTLRAMIESAFNIMPKDESDAARSRRAPPGFKCFDGLEFIGKIGIEKGGANPQGGNYNDKNKLELVITPDMKEYAPAMNGETVAVAAKAEKATQAAAVPAWGAPATATAPVATTATGGAKKPAWV